jgi:alanine dehydrogenase
MTRILRDADLEGLIDLPQIVARMEDGYRADARGEVTLFPRRRVEAAGVSVAWLGAVVPSEDILGYRSYLHGAEVGDRGEQVVTLYRHSDMALRAVFLGRLVGNLRTGATLAAALHLVQPEVREVGLIGTGAQARNALACITATQRPDRVTAWSPSQDHREEFRGWAARALGLAVEPAGSAAEVVARAEAVVLATNADRPIFGPEALPGPRLLLSISAYRRPEIDPRILDAAPAVWTDSVVQAGEDGTLFATPERRAKLKPLGAGLSEGTAKDRATTRLVVNTGAAWEEVLLGKTLLERAESRGRGVVVAMPDEPPGAAVF